MNTEFEYGDILIKRVSNGWVAVVGNENSNLEEQSKNVSCFVYEDSTHNEGNRESLANMLSDQFGCYMQSKRQCGVNISFNPMSKEQEDEIMYLQRNES